MFRRILITIALYLTVSTVGADPATFKDCAACPEMVVVPAGSFTMGEPLPAAGEKHRSWGGPPVRIEIAHPFAIARTEITNAQFRAFVSDTGHQVTGACRTFWPGPEPTWRDPHWPDQHQQADQHPVVCVGFEDAQAYVAWLNRKAPAGRTYDLPSEAQFEYVARAGDERPYPWASETQACRVANVADRHYAATDQPLPTIDCDDGYASTAPAASFAANAFGVYDMIGNVWEWIADCSADDYATLPRDGDPRADPGTCTGRHTRGGSFLSSGMWLRLSARGGLHPVPGSNHVSLGFRVVASHRDQASATEPATQAANRHAGSVPLLLQPCLVPRCTTQSPGLRSTSVPSPMTMVICPDTTTT